MSLKIVSTKIKSVNKTRQVTKAMEAVSAVKMRKSQATALAARPYARAALSMLRTLSRTTDVAEHPLATVRPIGKTCYVVITSDRGLAGSLNSAVLKACLRDMAAQGLSHAAVSVVTIGARGTGFFNTRSITSLGRYERWGDFISYDEVAPAIATARRAFESGACDTVKIVYTNFLSTLKQEAVVRTLLPLDPHAVEEVVEGITPERGRYAELRREDTAVGRRDTSRITPLFEPNPRAVLDTLLPALLNVYLYHAVLEANASEHSSRMVAMKNASENAGTMLKGLKLSYNKARQAGITQEVSEIVGGTEALATSN